MKRENSIDVSRGIAVILMVVGHIWTTGKIHAWIYSFHMPLFFLISGLVGKWETPTINDFKDKIYKFIRRLVVPYFLMMMFSGEATIENIKNYILATREILDRYPLKARWFLPCMFVSSLYVTIGFYLTGKIANERLKLVSRLFVMVGFFVSGMLFDGNRCGNDNIWMWNVALMAAFFIILGFFAKEWWFSVIKESMPIIVLCGVVAIVISVFSFERVVDTDFGMVFVAGIYGNPAFFLIAAISGSIFVLCAGKILEQIEALKYIGMNSLTIMIFHGLFLTCPLPLVQTESRTVRFVFVFICSMIAVYLVNTFVPEFSGRWTEKETKQETDEVQE